MNDALTWPDAFAIATPIVCITVIIVIGFILNSKGKL